MRFLFVDRILEFERGKRILGTKTFTMMDSYLDVYDHQRQIVPATLLVECLAQIGGWLNLISRNFGVKTLLVLVEGVRVHRLVRLGDTVLLDVQMLYTHPDGVTVRGVMRIDSDILVVAERIVLACETTSDPAFIEERRRHLRGMNPALAQYHADSAPISVAPSAPRQKMKETNGTEGAGEISAVVRVPPQELSV